MYESLAVSCEAFFYTSTLPTTLLYIDIEEMDEPEDRPSLTSKIKRLKCANKKSPA